MNQKQYEVYRQGSSRSFEVDGVEREVFRTVYVTDEGPMSDGDELLATFPDADAATIYVLDTVWASAKPKEAARE
jgi:hypothetical protein